MNRLGVMLWLAVLACLTGCKSSLVPFSHELRTQHDLSSDDVKRLQFYVSHSVTLRRELRAQGRTIEDGHLQLTAGKIVEQVVIREHTPGVPVEVGEHLIRVSFEEGSALDFSVRGAVEPIALPLKIESGGYATAPNPFPGQQGDPEPEEPASILGSYFLATDADANKVNFQGKLWDAIQDSFRAHLMIDARSLDEVVESKTVLGGRRF